jgi:hypothetical protein
VTPRGGPARPIGEDVGGALRSLGVPSKALSNRVRAAWEKVADPAWRGRAEPERIVAGTLVVAVESAALRHEIAQFHAERLLERLKALLPGDSLVEVRFRPGRVGGASPTS